LPLVGLAGLLGLGGLPCHWLPGAAGAATALAMPASQAAPLVVRVDLGEWSLTPSRVAVAAGRPVRFLATNRGAIPHALVVEGEGVYAETQAIGSAGTARLDVTFDAPGVFDLFCPLGDGQHRLLGQDGRLAAVAPEPGATYPLTGEAAEAAIVQTVLGPEAGPGPDAPGPPTDPDPGAGDPAAGDPAPPAVGAGES
jgi:plastocyanin